MKGTLIILLLCFVSVFGWGVDYYVADSDGSDSYNGLYASFQSGTDGPWKTIGKANTTLTEGDTVYIRVGTYNISGSAIDPANTGASGNVITYSGYQDEVVTFQGTSVSSFAIDLDSEYGTVRSYIKVTKLNFENFNQHMWIRKGDHNEISYCSIVGMYDEENLTQWIGSVMYRHAQYNWIHHCTFGKYGFHNETANGGDGDDEGVLFEIGNDDVATGDETHHNLVEDSVFYHGGHHVVSIDGYNNVFRNNYVHNEAWSPVGNPTYGNRMIFSVGATDDDVYRNLIECNRIAYGGETCEHDQIGGSGGTIASSYNIIRKNMFYQCLIYGTLFRYYGSGTTYCNYNHIYNNVYWYNGYTTTGQAKGDPPGNSWDDVYTHGILCYDDATSIHDNIFKNNIFYQNKCLKGTQYSIIEGWPDYNLPDLQTISDNWFDNDGDPEFVNIIGTPDPDEEKQFDFRLQLTSSCIDAGGFLTTITSANGSGTSFVVNDAGYFMDGWGIIDGDMIQLEGQTVTATITGVNYSTNIITVDTSLTWTQGDGIALAYNGTAPDQGAYEYQPGCPNIFITGMIFAIWPSLVPMIWFVLVAWFCLGVRIVNKL